MTPEETNARIDRLIAELPEVLVHYTRTELARAVEALWAPVWAQCPLHGWYTHAPGEYRDCATCVNP